MDTLDKEIKDKMQEKASREAECPAKIDERFKKYIEQTNDEIINPGYYDVVEADYDGMRSTSVMTIKVNEPTNLKTIAKKLYMQREYISPWNYLVIKEYEPKFYINLEDVIVDKTPDKNEPSEIDLMSEKIDTLQRVNAYLEHRIKMYERLINTVRVAADNISQHERISSEIMEEDDEPMTEILYETYDSLGIL